MFKIGLLGKKYVDTILHVNNVVLGETNNCTSLKEKLGGCFNFLDSDIKDVHLECITRGVKIAYIVCDTKKSTRSSFVIDSKPSNISLQDISFINREFDWIHVCYLDDLEVSREKFRVSNYTSFIGKNSLPTSQALTGFLLRSTVVRDYPGIEVSANT